jgi:hypothetical protein
MNLKPVQLQLTTDDIDEIMHISLDDDNDRALIFVKVILAKRVEKALRRH